MASAAQDRQARWEAYQALGGDQYPLRVRELLHDFRLAIVGHRPLEEAIVTAGGIDTRQVDPRTMASRLVRGLYFAGEVLNVQADTGGYNLQAAFSTGYVAGRAAAELVAGA